MKRSQINEIIAEAKDYFEELNFKLPPWAFWRPEDWRGKSVICREIIDNMLGWDITDFGEGQFDTRGLLLFTVRNGNLEQDDKTYAEKIMMVREGQETPYHYHWYKMEDIINRGGGNLALQLAWADENDELADRAITVQLDGITREYTPEDTVILTPGESITLPPKLYHRFYGAPDTGTVLVGEVSKVNDDNTDNKFLDPLGRFPEVEEDVEPLHLLVSDYPVYV